MGILDDTELFTAVIQQGGFSHAAKHLGISNGLVSRRIAQLELKLGVTLIKRTTRQLQLTPEGELFWQHALRIQQEIDSAITLIQTSANKPKGIIRLSAPIYFGKQYLAPIILKFIKHFPDIKINLILSNKKLDPIKEQLDLVIRGVGFLEEASLKDSSMKMKLLIKEKIGLYASPDYLAQFGEPLSIDTLENHAIINFSDKNQVSDHDTWSYCLNHKECSIKIKPTFNCNDIETNLLTCMSGSGIARFTELNVKDALQKNQLRPILSQYTWGFYHLFAIYSRQDALPKRTRLLLDFITDHTKHLLSFPKRSV